jgi:formylglycine-generating enzyme required for sulfatase activity
MVVDPTTPRSHSSLPMAPRLQRSARLRHALRSPPREKQQTARATRPTRTRLKGNLFAFAAAQVLIAVVAFVVVTDYVADGPLKLAVSDVLRQAAGDRGETRAGQTELAAATPSVAVEEASNQEITAAREIPSSSEPVEKPATEIEKQVATEEALPKAQEPTADMLEAPPASAPADISLAEIQEPIVATEPAPQAEEPIAAPLIQPQAAEKAAEDVAALVPVPDLAPQADAPATAPPAEPVEPKPAVGQTIRDCATCPELVVVNAGRFAMGEGLEHQASVTGTQDVAIAAPFAIGRYEITFDEWSECVADGGCTSQPADETWGRGRRPAINVSFNDITQQYLPWLSGKTGFTYRLPTEAEWEFAARGGAAAAAGQAYSFGDDAALLCQHGNSSDLAGTSSACSDGFATTAPAGSLKPNMLGLFDMHGNVWEWTADCWQPQYSAKATKATETCTTRVLRGGSWASSAAALRSAARGWESQDKSKNSIGFRVARTLP